MTLDNRLRKMHAAVSRFIQKADRRNEPLEAFRETESFQQFQDKLSTGIRKQASWLAANISGFEDLKNEDLSDSEFEATFGKWLKNEMPVIHSFVSEDKVYAYLFNAFDFSVRASYLRIGVIHKAEGFIEFELTNANYIAALKNQANYLLNQSSVDETTRKRMITMIRDTRLSLVSLDELTEMLIDQFVDISETRAFQIANTETNQAMSTAQMAFLKENDFMTKRWIGAGPRTCQICQGNEDDGPIGVDENFTSGHQQTPGHPSCECYIEPGEEIDLDSVPLLWDGS